MSPSVSSWNANYANYAYAKYPMGNGNQTLKGAPSGLRRILANESPLKKKNAFYFTLKAFSFSRYSSFVLTFRSYLKTGWLER